MYKIPTRIDTMLLHSANKTTHLFPHLEMERMDILVFSGGVNGRYNNDNHFITQ